MRGARTHAPVQLTCSLKCVHRRSPHTREHTHTYTQAYVSHNDTRKHLSYTCTHTRKPQARVLHLLRDVAAGLTYLHSKNVMHADLKVSQEQRVDGVWFTSLIQGPAASAEAARSAARARRRQTVHYAPRQRRRILAHAVPACTTWSQRLHSSCADGAEEAPTKSAPLPPPPHLPCCARRATFCWPPTTRRRWGSRPRCQTLASAEPWASARHTRLRAPWGRSRTCP
jgi:hypothetical protein